MTGPVAAGQGDRVIETIALTKRYPGGVTALDSLTVEIPPGITGLIGANGAGKSTLIKILLGLVPPTKGLARVMGLDCASARTLVGYMPEHDCLPPDVSATEFVTHLARMSGLPAVARAAAGRADQRAGPGRAHRDAGADRPDRGRVRPVGGGRLAPAGGDRADRRAPGRGGVGG